MTKTELLDMMTEKNICYLHLRLLTLSYLRLVCVTLY